MRGAAALPAMAGALAVLGLLAIDVAAVPAVLPSVRVELGSSSSGLVWVQDAYLLAMAVTLLLVSGTGVDRRLLAAVGVAVFAGGALLASTADETATVVTGRALQGIGIGGLLVPALESLRPGDRWTLALVGAGGLLALAVAPLAGGAVAEEASWPWLFRVELVVVVPALLPVAVGSGRRAHGGAPRGGAAPGGPPSGGAASGGAASGGAASGGAASGGGASGEPPSGGAASGGAASGGGASGEPPSGGAASGGAASGWPPASGPPAGPGSGEAPHGLPLRGDRTAALATGLILAVTGLVQSGPWGWASADTLLLVAGGAALIVFARRERPAGRDAPVLVLGGCLAAGLLVAPQYLELVRGLSPLRSGLLTAVLTVSAGTLAALARILAGRVTPRMLLVGGLGCAALGALGMTRIDPASSYALVVISLGLLGSGIGAAAGALATRACGHDRAGGERATPTGSVGRLRHAYGAFDGPHSVIDGTRLAAAAASGGALVVAAAGALLQRAQLEERESGGSFEDAVAAGLAASGWLMAALLAAAAVLAWRRASVD